MIHYIRSKISRKMLAGLLLAQVIGLALVVLVTLLVSRPRLEQEALSEAVETGEYLAGQIDAELDSMCRYTESLSGTLEMKNALSQYEEGDSSELVSYLTSLTELTYFNIRAAAIKNGENWVYSDTALGSQDSKYLDAPSMQALSYDTPGPLFTTIYPHDGTENDSLAVGVSIRSDGGQDYRLVLLFDATALMERIDQTLSYSYTGFEIGKNDSGGFYQGGDSGQSHTVLAENTQAGNYVLEQNGYYIITQTSYSWRICGYISAADFAALYMPSIGLAIGLCVLLFALSLLVTLPVMQGISRPIASLQQVMETAAAGDLEVQADETGEDELSKLGGYFNHMLSEIKSHTENRVRLEVAELNLKQSLLMSQVNYHFIYNTMSTINALARRQDYERIQQVNSALADILQNNMLVSGYSMTGRLADELNTARQYWVIESISRRGTAELDIDCPDELLSCVVPKSILQPLVENSLRHGLIDAETGQPAGRVEITVSAQEDKLSIQVTDNGRGMDSETLNCLRAEGDERISSGRHIGIANIRKRLEYLYGDQAVMEIDSSPNGTVIRLFIPYQG